MGIARHRKKQKQGSVAMPRKPLLLSDKNCAHCGSHFRVLLIQPLMFCRLICKFHYYKNAKKSVDPALEKAIQDLGYSDETSDLVSKLDHFV